MRHHRLPAAIAILLALVLSLGACGDDDDDDGGDANGDASGSASAVTDEDGDGEADAEEEPSEPLSEEEARAAGNPETFARIEAYTDCMQLTKERDNFKENAERRSDDPERQSILEAYIKAAEERMEELGC